MSLVLRERRNRDRHTLSQSQEGPRRLLGKEGKEETLALDPHTTGVRRAERGAATPVGFRGHRCPSGADGGQPSHVAQNAPR